jgi:hypothetical protein
MCSVILFHHCEARKYRAAAPCFLKPELRRKIPAAPETAAKLRRPKLATLLSLAALVFLAGGVMARAQEISPPILSSGLGDATAVRIDAIGKLRQPPATESPFAAANLPPIESIGAGSSIGPFLASGIRPDLTRAALRRAWSTDPAIRDFVGLSESSWDFNASEVSGFGSLTADDARHLLAQVMEGTESLDSEHRVAERLASKSSRR